MMNVVAPIKSSHQRVPIGNVVPAILATATSMEGVAKIASNHAVL